MTKSDECFKDKEYRFWKKPQGNSRSLFARVWLWLFRDTSWMFAPGYFDGAEDKTPESEGETKELTRYGKALGFDEHDKLLDDHTKRLDKLYCRMRVVLFVSSFYFLLRQFLFGITS